MVNGMFSVPDAGSISAGWLMEKLPASASPAAGPASAATVRTARSGKRSLEDMPPTIRRTGRDASDRDHRRGVTWSTLPQRARRLARPRDHGIAAGGASRAGRARADRLEPDAVEGRGVGRR